MAVDTQTYFRGLRSYLNTNTYEVTKREKDGRIVLEEKIFLPGGVEKKEKVRLAYSGEVIAIQLDKKNQQGKSDPLFHFLEDKAKPWSKRCDFIIFQLLKKNIYVYCIEFKSASLPEGLVDQLKASEAWCKTLQSIINLYTGDKKRLNLKKFVFSCMDNPSAFLDTDGYIQRDHSIKHYHYDELKTIKLEELENACPILVG